MSILNTSSDTLTKMAENQWAVCITDLVNLLKESIHNFHIYLKEKGYPSFFYVQLRNVEGDDEKFVIDCRVEWQSCTCRPQLECLDKRRRNSNLNVEPHHLFPDLAKFIRERLGGNGNLILILDHLHKLNYRQLLHLATCFKYSNMKCGTVMICDSKHLKRFRKENPSEYKEFVSRLTGIVWRLSDIGDPEFLTSDTIIANSRDGGMSIRL